MPEQEPHDLDEVLARARAGIAGGDQPERHPDDVELHAPMRLRREPVELDPETEAVLRARLGRGAGE